MNICRSRACLIDHLSATPFSSFDCLGRIAAVDSLIDSRATVAACESLDTGQTRTRY